MVVVPEYKKHREKSQGAEPDSDDPPPQAQDAVVPPFLACPPASEEESSTAAASSAASAAAAPRSKKAKTELTEEERSKRRKEASQKLRDEMAQLADVPPRLGLEGVEFRHGDSTMEPHLGYDHIYMFDRVFSRLTLKALSQKLQESPFRVLVSSRHWREWWGLGLSKVQPVAKVRMATTGKEKVTQYVYINAELFPMPDELLEPTSSGEEANGDAVAAAAQL